ncbi:VanZ family protein [Acetobacterium tundrae]|uniref:VanZ family protein n=1 Tax=Acetobacterium tundrae TaxID=132932 RepID=UPI001A9C0F52|nr:VanZ family protein [Acetobacterium tundrae]
MAYENDIDEDEAKKRNTVILLGFLISVSVECLQLITKTGIFEWDDIIHNTIGVIVGYGIYLYLKNHIRGEDHQYFRLFIN